MSHELKLPIVPNFLIEGNRYILLRDIQKVFSIREDYALAASVKIAEQSDGFCNIPKKICNNYSILDILYSDSFIQ